MSGKMPSFSFLDVVYDGDEDVFDKLVLYSSIYAVWVLNVEAELRSVWGEPHVFYPVNRSPAVIEDFLREFRLAFHWLTPFFEIPLHSPPPSPTAPDSG